MTQQRQTTVAKFRSAARALADYLRMIKFSHTLFALPFALSAILIIFVRYRQNVVVTPVKWLLLIVAFSAMRSFAMSVNRIADHKIDAQNPRTLNREIPSGKLSTTAVTLFAIISLAVLVASATLLSPLAAIASVPAALIVALYSYTKRFTWLCHFWLGAAIAMAPSAVYVALLQDIYPEALLMGGALLFYISGFDILYSLQDRDFDIKNRLHSVPVRFGIAGALAISRAAHCAATIFVGALIYQLKLSPISWGLMAALAMLFLVEHILVGSSRSLRYTNIPIAFFHVNSAISLVFLALITGGLFIH